jgi:hypothetical protein
LVLENSKTLKKFAGHKMRVSFFSETSVPNILRFSKYLASSR